MAHNYDPQWKDPQTRKVQAWQMTPERWVAFCAARYAEISHGAPLCTLSRQLAIIMHHIAVRDAMAAGEDVQPEVYRHYPEMHPQAPAARFEEEVDYEYTEDCAADCARAVRHA